MEKSNRDKGDYGKAPLLKLKEAAKYLGVHPMTLYRLRKKLILPFVKLGGQYRIHQVALDRWIESKSNIG